MQGLTLNFTLPRILLCEGREDVRFFKAFLKNLGVADVDVLETGGKANYGAVVAALVRHPNYAQMSSLGITRDADDNPIGAFQSVCHALHANGLVVPSRAGAVAGGQPRVGVMILPDNASTGMLEDLCLLSVQADPAYPCIDALFQCITRQGRQQPHPMAKARIHAWLATQPIPEKRLGEAAKSGYWPWNDQAFDAIRQFIRAL